MKTQALRALPLAVGVGRVDAQDLAAGDQQRIAEVVGSLGANE